MEEAKPAPPGWIEGRERVHWRMCWVVSLFSVSMLLGDKRMRNLLRTITYVWQLLWRSHL